MSTPFKPGDLIWLSDDMGILTPAIYISEATSSILGPRIKVLHAKVIFDIGKHRMRVNNETR
jgi:hypothetical protein